MKAKLNLVNLTLPVARIRPRDPTLGIIGHDFDLLPEVEVAKRTMGALSGEGIDVPKLEWRERIEWFQATAGPKIGLRGGAPPVPALWNFVGANSKDMYADNPTSNTFKSWHAMKYFWATQNPPNAPPPGLRACFTQQPNSDAIETAAKHWIAANGFRWKIADLTDRPGMGVTGGSGGGGGASLVTTDTRRRVIYFDLGFSGSPTRVKFVQVLETVNGVPTINKFINQDVTKAQVDDPVNLARWRTQVATPGNFAF